MHNLGWLREYLSRLSETDPDKENAEQILETFRLLWAVAKAGARYRDLRTNESLETFCAALEALKPPKEPNPRRIAGPI